MSEPFKVDERVWKQGDGYAGEGKIVAIFKNWMGQPRYVVAHQIEGGGGHFYHIYGPKQLSRERPPVHDGG